MRGGGGVEGGTRGWKKKIKKHNNRYSGGKTAQEGDHLKGFGHGENCIILGFLAPVGKGENGGLVRGGGNAGL